MLSIRCTSMCQGTTAVSDSRQYSFFCQFLPSSENERQMLRDSPISLTYHMQYRPPIFWIAGLTIMPPGPSRTTAGSWRSMTVSRSDQCMPSALYFRRMYVSSRCVRLMRYQHSSVSPFITRCVSEKKSRFSISVSFRSSIGLTKSPGVSQCMPSCEAWMHGFSHLAR